MILEVYNTIMMLFGMLGGFILFGERMSGADTCYYLLGIATVVVRTLHAPPAYNKFSAAQAGMLMLTQNVASSSDEDGQGGTLLGSRENSKENVLDGDEKPPYGSVLRSPLSTPKLTLEESREANKLDHEARERSPSALYSTIVADDAGSAIL